MDVPGDYNPWRKPPYCVHCDDARVVSTTDTFRRHDKIEKSEVVPCPYCGTAEKLAKLRIERHRIVNPPPGISERDLTDEERIVVKDWRNRGHHMQDCLRWIEGRRYKPGEDPTFSAELVAELGQWRRLSGRGQGRVVVQAVIERPALPPAPDESERFDFEDEEAP